MRAIRTGELYGGERLEATLARLQRPAHDRAGRRRRAARRRAALSRPARSPRTTSPCWRCAGTAPVAGRRQCRWVTAQRTTISTRRLRGSATPSASARAARACRVRSPARSPRATPRRISSRADDLGALQRERVVDRDRLPTASVWPITSTSGTGRRAISAKTPSTSALRLLGELVPAFDEIQRERRGARRLRGERRRRTSSSTSSASDWYGSWPNARLAHRRVRLVEHDRPLASRRDRDRGSRPSLLGQQHDRRRCACAQRRRAARSGAARAPRRDAIATHRH